MAIQGKPVFKAARFEVWEHQVSVPGGQLLVRHSVQHPGSVAILPLLPDGQVCLIRNERVAVGETVVEIPAGTLDRSEAPWEAARRELTEETGYRANRIESLGRIRLSPGILNEQMELFLATGIEPGPSQLEPGEQIENLVVPWSEALEMIRDGRIEDAKTVACLLYYECFRRSQS